MRVIDLTRERGNFETGAYCVDGARSYGLWNDRRPEAGDLVVIQRSDAKVCYRVETSERQFTGSDGRSFWIGRMRDTRGWFDESEVDALADAGLA